MIKQLTALGVLALSTTTGFAGGIDRSGQSILSIFEKGNYAELSFGNVMPNVSGIGAGTIPNGAQPTPGQDSGNMAKSYNQIGMAVKTDLNESLAFAMILDQPFGADVAYAPGTTYYARGTHATLKTTALTGVLKYTLPSNISVYGGLRYQTMSAEAFIPFIPTSGYSVSSDTASGVGYLVGVAYEKPEIALRVALTFNSEITHNFNTIEFELADRVCGDGWHHLNHDAEKRQPRLPVGRGQGHAGVRLDPLGRLVELCDRPDLLHPAVATGQL